jgi:pimeloyl-ACP methyl ester carboxylesterase
MNDLRRLHVPADDGTLLSVRIHENPQATLRLVLSHGNGLAIDGFRVFWEPLCERHEVVLVDFRGHGQSEAGPDGHHQWDIFTRDAECVFQALRRQPGPALSVGVFHSMSAVTSLLQLRAFGPRWDALVLFDPSLSPPPGHRLEGVHQAEMQRLTAVTLRRRRRFPDPSELARQFARAEVFGPWQGSACRDMAEATLRVDGDGDGWSLRCDPQREARIFETNIHLPVWDVLRRPRCPLQIVAGDPSLPGAQAPSLVSRAAHEDLGVSHEAVTGTGHFLQLEAPQRSRQALERWLDRTLLQRVACDSDS